MIIRLKIKFIYIICGEFDDFLSLLGTAYGLLLVNSMFLPAINDHLGGSKVVTVELS